MLDRGRAALPLWVQVMHDLSNHVVLSTPVGAPIPSESELQKRYRVSRVVIRQAVDELCRMGVVRKEQGRGTFVRLGPIEDQIGDISSWTSIVSRSGRRPSTGSRQVDVVALPGELSDVFPYDTAEIVRVRRVRLIDEVPVTLATGYIPRAFVLDLEAFARHESLYRALEQHGVHLARATQVIRARAATVSEARDLLVEREFPLIQVERVSFDAPRLHRELGAQWVQSILRVNPARFLGGDELA